MSDEVKVYAIRDTLTGKLRNTRYPHPDIYTSKSSVNHRMRELKKEHPDFQPWRVVEFTLKEVANG